MSAPEVGDKVVEGLQKDFSLVIVNFANPDMVGHTGDMDAAIKAVETVDKELEKVTESAKKNGYEVLVIADHGNADCMIQPDGSAHTAHTTAPVPVVLVTERDVKLKNGILADVSPTLLKMMDLDQPEEMTGKSLF
jgi:2,3-bisphosphoglycerate-independent phosphoglycerate mutase